MKRRAAVAAAALALFPAGTAQGAFRFAQTNVSNAVGRQAETAIAADPANPQVLLAASNSGIVGGANFRVSALAYGSTDGGATWTRSEPVPPRDGNCDYGDPAPGIGPDGAQYLATLVAPCDLSGAREDESVALVVSRRSGPDAPWTTSPVSPPDSQFNDKPALTVDNSAASAHRGRIYVASSLSGPDARAFSVVAARSDDGGATWSAPVRVSRAGLRHSPEQFVSLAVDAAGTLFVAWGTGVRDVYVARSSDGGDTFGLSVLVASPAGIRASAARVSDPDRSPASAVRHAGAARHLRRRPDRRHLQRRAAPAGRLRRHPRPGPRAEALARARQPSGRAAPGGPVPADDGLRSPSTGRLWSMLLRHARRPPPGSRALLLCVLGRPRHDVGPSFPVASVASDEVHRPADAGFGFGDFEGVVAAGGVVHPIWTDGRLVRTRGEEIFTTAFQGGARRGAPGDASDGHAPGLTPRQGLDGARPWV